MRRAAALLTLLLCGCATKPPVAAKRVEVPLGGTRVATFEYLGAGGWLIRRGNDAVMTAPFFTNTHYLFLLRAGALNESAIARHIGMIDGGVGDVRAVLAGHAHYDHLMDLPAVAKHLPRTAMVLGGDTVCNSLGRNFWRPCIAITDHAGTRYHEPRGYHVAKNVIVRPYFSEHAAHLFKFKLFGGHYGEMADAVPARPVLWREGETLAYLIDFMSDDGKTVELRVYYNDSAPSSPYGLPDEKTMARNVDVAILCVASHAQQADYPKKYLEVMKPRHLLLGHWESFFGSFDKPVTAVRGTDVAAFLDAVKGHSYTLPDRHTVVTVRY